jgi:hypothetical protein
MSGAYLWLKLAHILIAIVALGTGAALGIVLELFADDPVNGAFVLVVVRRLAYFVVAPGYVLMLVTGMWMGSIGSLLDAHWTEAAMNLWGVGALLLAASLVLLHKRVRGRASSWGRVFGGGAGLVTLAIVWFMVMKPA